MNLRNPTRYRGAGEQVHVRGGKLSAVVVRQVAKELRLGADRGVADARNKVLPLVKDAQQVHQMRLGNVIHFTYCRLSGDRKKRMINKMVQFKKIGAAVAIFLALNAILYTHDVTDGRLIPQKGNVLHGFLFRETVKRSAGAAVLQAARSGKDPLAAQVVRTHSQQFGLNN